MIFDIRRNGIMAVSAEDGTTGRTDQVVVVPIVTAHKLDFRCDCGSTVEIRRTPDGETQLFCFGCHKIRGRLALGVEVH
jgi:hypothetical protein